MCFRMHSARESRPQRVCVCEPCFHPKVADTTETVILFGSWRTGSELVRAPKTNRTCCVNQSAFSEDTLTWGLSLRAVLTPVGEETSQSEEIW